MNHHSFKLDIITNWLWLGYKEKEKMKEHKQKMQLVLVDDLLDKMEQLANKTIRVDYQPSKNNNLKIRFRLSSIKKPLKRSY